MHYSSKFVTTHMMQTRRSKICLLAGSHDILKRPDPDVKYAEMDLICSYELCLIKYSLSQWLRLCDMYCRNDDSAHYSQLGNHIERGGEFSA